MEVLPADTSKAITDTEMLSEEHECVEVTEASSMINAEQGSGIVSTAEKRKHSEESEINDNTNLIPHKRACMGSAKDVEHDHTYSVSSASDKGK